MRENKQKRSRIKAFNRLKENKSEEQKGDKTRKPWREGREIYLSGIGTFSKNLGIWSKKELADADAQEVRTELRKLRDDIDKLL